MSRSGSGTSGGSSSRSNFSGASNGSFSSSSVAPAEEEVACRATVVAAHPDGQPVSERQFRPWQRERSGMSWASQAARKTRGTNPAGPCESGPLRAPCSVACRLGLLSCVRLAQKIWSRGFGALMKAAEGDHVEIVKLLVENRADLERTNHRGQTALSIAAAPPYSLCLVTGP